MAGTRRSLAAINERLSSFQGAGNYYGRNDSGNPLGETGFHSDRCGINRQIKAENALIRELKATVKKLMQIVKNTIPAIAEAMEKLHGNILIFSYQLRHIGAGKYSMGRHIKAVKPELKRYAGLV